MLLAYFSKAALEVGGLDVLFKGSEFVLLDQGKIIASESHLNMDLNMASSMDWVD
jgi:hypothetical protein